MYKIDIMYQKNVCKHKKVVDISDYSHDLQLCEDCGELFYGTPKKLKQFPPSFCLVVHKFVNDD